MTAINSALLFLINLTFDLYIMALLLRFFLQYQKADFYNPVSQAVMQITSKPFLKPLRKIIPGYYGLDFAIIFLAFSVLIVKFILINIITVHYLPNIFSIIIWSIGSFIESVLSLYFWCIIISAIMSFIPNFQFNPIYGVFNKLTNPVLNPIRKKIPAFGGFDFSPFIACILITLLQILISQPIINLAFSF